MSRALRNHGSYLGVKPAGLVGVVGLHALTESADKLVPSVPMTYLGSDGGTANNGEDITVSFTNFTPQPGDLVILLHVEADTATDNIDDMSVQSSGYQDLFASAHIDTIGESINLRVAYKVMGASPDADVSVLGSDDSSSGSALLVLGMRNAGVPVLRETATGSSGTVTPQSMTAANSGSMALGIVAQGFADGTGSPPGSYDHSGEETGVDTQRASVSFGLIENISAGAVSFYAHSLSDAGGSSIAVSIEVPAL